MNTDVTSSPAQTSEVPLESTLQPNPSPRPSPTTTIPASIPESSGENLGGHSSSEKSLSGNEGRKFAKGESSVQRDPLFDEMPEDTIDHMETENAENDETIAKVLLNMSQAKAVSKEKEKGVELKDEAEEERNRIAEEKAANEELIRDFDDMKARIEADRLLAEKLQEQEREQFTIEERAKFLHDTIAAQMRKFLAQQTIRSNKE
ncbi:hypothetical protein Tco_0599210 [Tanacetum coccineum]